jgi:hypothetical protein
LERIVEKETNVNETQGKSLELLEFDEPEGQLVAYAIHGKITAEDARPIFERFAAASEAGTKIRVFADMQDYGGFELDVIGEKVKHLGAIFKTIERMAVVGDAGWMAIWAKVFDPVTGPDLRHFSSDQGDAALAWLQGP